VNHVEIFFSSLSQRLTHLIGPKYKQTLEIGGIHSSARMDSLDREVGRSQRRFEEEYFANKFLVD
jgi:hypothetical protein